MFSVELCFMTYGIVEPWLILDTVYGIHVPSHFIRLLILRARNILDLQWLNSEKDGTHCTP